MSVVAQDLELLRRSLETGELVTVTVTDCLYTCCSRGWSRREYEAPYHGKIAQLDMHTAHPWLLLIAPGIGTISYSIQAELAHVVDVT